MWENKQKFLRRVAVNYQYRILKLEGSSKGQRIVSKTMQLSKQLSRHNGFTIIELLIVIAIIGILSAIAYPSYQKHMHDTRRSDAHLSLLEAAQAMERCKATQYSYANCAVNVSTTTAQNFYTISADPAPTAATYTLVAEAIGAQVHDTTCPEITLDQLGRQTPEACWK